MKIAVLLVTTIILEAFLIGTEVDALKCYACNEGKLGPHRKKAVKCDNKIVVDCGTAEDVACLRQIPSMGRKDHMIKKCSSMKLKFTRMDSEEEMYDDEEKQFTYRRICKTDLCNA